MLLSNQEDFDGATTFTRMREVFERAKRRTPAGCSEFFYTFAGRLSRLQVVGQKLAQQITLPFSHLRTVPSDSDVPTLTIDLWDARELRTSAESKGVSHEFEPDSRLQVSPDGRFVLHRIFYTTTVLDRATHQIIGYVTDSDRLSLYERGRPLHFPLLLWHNDRGLQAIHAGLVSRNGHGVLLGGAGGSGKSTSALSCLSAGFQYLSDDYVGLELLGDGQCIGHSLYCSAHLEPEHLTRFTSLQPHVIPGSLPQEEKFLFLLSQIFPERLARCVPIRALVLPRVADLAESQFRPATKGEALLRVAPTSLLLLPQAGTRGFHKLAQLVERVPCYWLDLGRNLHSIPRRVEDILAEVI